MSSYAPSTVNRQRRHEKRAEERDHGRRQAMVCNVLMVGHMQNSGTRMVVPAPSLMDRIAQALMESHHNPVAFDLRRLAWTFNWTFNPIDQADILDVNKPIDDRWMRFIGMADRFADDWEAPT